MALALRPGCSKIRVVSPAMSRARFHALQRQLFAVSWLALTCEMTTLRRDVHTCLRVLTAIRKTVATLVANSIAVGMPVTGHPPAQIQQKPDDAELAQCWNPSAKETIGRLAKDSLVEKIADVLKSDGRKGGKVDLKQISSRIDVSTDNYFAVSIDRTAGSITCGTQVTMAVTRDGALAPLRAENRQSSSRSIVGN
ncbi:hypothetical protein CBA19CS11_29355 [Caballeronia novacaledonica]|uniref:hypothetical protein n=1 Tax=Caballeronia novacaledonica TaxID=1544861 RepID=UPI001EE351D9|nr:hypothetical protein [Caballeronia novacaledonica]GJH13031.1 hypothetical protein CBA19CS11_29355 [Caballeronia novacaledonica]